MIHKIRAILKIINSQQYFLLCDQGFSGSYKEKQFIPDIKSLCKIYQKGYQEEGGHDVENDGRDNRTSNR